MHNYPVIILAGGKAKRLGVPKTLFTHPSYQGHWLDAQAKALQALGLEKIIIVVGFHAKREMAIFSHLHLVVNPHPGDGPFSSLQVGLSHLKAKRVFVLPIDVPVPKKQTWLVLIRALKGGMLAACPKFRDRGGHPVLLSKRLAREIINCEPTSRLDELLREYSRSVVKVDVEDPRVSYNFNTPSQFLKWEKNLREQTSSDNRAIE